MEFYFSSSRQADVRRIVVRQWRVTEADPSGCVVWFDPTREVCYLYELDPPAELGVVAYREGDDQYGLLEENQVKTGSSDDDLPF